MHHRIGMSWSLWVVILALCLPPPILCAQDIEPEEEDEDEATAVPLEGTGGGVVYTPLFVGALVAGAGAGFVITKEDDEGDSPLDRTTSLREPEETTGGGGGRSRVDTSVIVYILSGQYDSSDATCDGPSSITFVSNVGVTLKGSSAAVVDGLAPSQPDEGNCPCGDIRGAGAAQVNPNTEMVDLSGVECEYVTGGPGASTFFNYPNWTFDRGNYIDIGDNKRVIRAIVHPDGAVFRLVSP
jgi:hypothetical protein